MTTGAQPRAKETVLFQGDSITDCGRSRDVAAPNRAAALGTGYPLLIASEVLAEQPRRDIAFFNRGISGNRVPDLTARWQADTLDLRPDVLSVLIGVNDLWHKLMGQSSGTVAEYESGYAALLSQASSALPGVRLVVLEPFVLRTGAVTGAWFPEFDERRAAARRVADAARATFVPLQGMFERLSRSAPPEYWAADGVHPTPAGHAEIARLWRQKVRL
ncbi:MAG TPA: SGNH/GDSL hydrolase family protein [Gemmatimonadales bacterium]